MYNLWEPCPRTRVSPPSLVPTMKASPATASAPTLRFKQDLEVQKLRSQALFTVPNFLSTSECDAFIKYAEELGFSHQGSLGPAKGEAFRDNDRISVQDSSLAENLWISGLSKLFENIKVDGKYASGLNPNVRFYRYREGQRFGPHIDDNVNLKRGQRTEYTLLIYLNGSGIKSKRGSSKGGNDVYQQLQGGETVFYTGYRREAIEVTPLAGMALLHLHGEKCMLHEARVVSKGSKYVLRSDVVFG